MTVRTLTREDLRKMRGAPATAAASLYWNEHGAVACSQHAPAKGTDTWKWERWKKIRPVEAVELLKQGMLACESCQAKAARDVAAEMPEEAREVILALKDEEWTGGASSAIDEFRRLGYADDEGLTPWGQYVAIAVGRLRGR